MFCPNCGQERISDATSFCSRCGFLLTGAAELLASGGAIRPTSSASSARSRGLKQGLFIFLLTFLVVPLVAIISVANDAEPWAVVIAAIVLFVGGLLRMAYALMFESGETAGGGTGHLPAELGARPNGASLPAASHIPASDYLSPGPGGWRNTNDLEPRTVTEGTTKLLEKEDKL